MSDFTEKYNDIGGTLLGGYAVYIAGLFYPALVTAIQFCFTFCPTYNSAIMPGIVVFGVVVLAIGILLSMAKEGSLTCWVLVIFLYLFTLGPFFQFFFYDADYVTYDEYEKLLNDYGRPGWIDGWDGEKYGGFEHTPMNQAPFPGFRWFWFLGEE